MNENKQHFAAEVIRRLKKAYPDAHCALNHTSPFELLIATILSAQCTDARVNIVTADDHEAGTITERTMSGQLTWRFQADSVRDFA